MRYSVYNYTTRRYDYYDGSGPKGAHAGTPPIRKARSALGATPEQSAWPVPSDAVPVGSGVMPQGRVGTLDAGPPEIPVIAIGIGAYLAWRLLR